MKNHTHYLPGSTNSLSINTIPGQEEYTFNSVPNFVGVESMSNVFSDGSKPFVDKRQSYRKVVSFEGMGTLSSLLTVSTGYILHQTSGHVGAQCPSYKTGNGATAYNNAVASLAEIVRGGIDLSIDGFQYKQSVSLARKLLDARKHAENIFKLIEIASRPKVKKQTRKLGKYARFRKTHKLDRGRVDKILRTPLKEVGSAWLEFTYGLSPTLQTIYDLVNREAVRVGNSLVIQRQYPNKPPKRHVTGNSKVGQIEKENRANSTTIYSTKSTYFTVIGGRYLPSSSYLEGLSRLSSLNPVSIGWELLPYSFVIDWFVDVGGYLRSMETALLSNSLGRFDGFRTNLEIHQTRCDFNQFGLNSGYVLSGGYTSNIREVIKNRNVLYSFPYPRAPTFSANLSSRRLLNAAALLTNFIRH